MESFADHQRAYREQHRTLGCKITHMFGTPIIAASIPLFLYDWRIGGGLFIFGWILQFIGHYVFEKNKPVFFGNPLNPGTYLAALIFASQEWARLLSGRPLVDRISKVP